jgi:hypothetical protein
MKTKKMEEEGNAYCVAGLQVRMKGRPMSRLVLILQPGDDGIVGRDGNLHHNKHPAM